ncbi:MAG: medium chain dehydrogenase/reductase family protein [Actinomycetota bacterium]|nr:medium chain dehydrogenase/reductase family protein [Actinomycetota bacterium]
MRALVITRHGPPEVLRVQELPDPVPGPGEVRIAVRAAGVNFADVLARMGLYPDAPRPPTVVGYEVAGEVESVGEGVEHLRPGDRVVAGTRFGGYAELAVTAAGNVLPLPGGWSFEEGAALPVTYATAYAGLIRYGALREGERVLVHAAAGGVGTAATQLAKLHGAEVFATASAPKHDAVRANGADHVIDYRARDVAREVRRIAGQKRPLDLVMDPIAGRSFSRSLGLLRPGGRLVCYGAFSVVGGEKRSIARALGAVAQTPRFSALGLMYSSRSVIGLNLLRLVQSKGSLDELVEPLRTFVEQDRISPVVGETFPLARGADAHRRLQDRANVGKLVLTV